MFGSLHEIMRQRDHRFLVGMRFARCVENATERYTEEDLHATVVNCDSREIWDSNNGRVPFNNNVDPLIPETESTCKQAQRVLDQVGALLYVFLVCTHPSEKRTSQTSRRVRAGEGGLLTRTRPSKHGKKSRRNERARKGREKRKADVANLLTTEFGQKKRAKNNKGGLRSMGSCISCHYRHEKCTWMNGELRCDKCPKLSEGAGLPPCPCFKYVGPGQGRRTDLRKSLLLDNSRTCREAFDLWCKRSVETEIVRIIHCL